MSKAALPPRMLTVAVIVRNAAEELEETLRSARLLADEIVVVDTGSSDATRQVAEQYGVKLFQRAWDNDFSAARNYAWDHAQGRWILWLDAGETIAAAQAASIRSWIESEADPAQVYLVTVHFPHDKPNIAAEQIARVRLTPNLPDLRFTGRVAETLLPSAANLQLGLGLAPFAAERGPRELDPQWKLRRARRNIELAQLAIDEEGPQSRLLICEGEAWQALGEQARAAECFRQALRRSQRGTTEMLAAFYGLFSALDADPSQRNMQLSLCLQALDIFPLDSQLLCALGGYLQTQGRADLAARSFETAYRYGQINPGAWHVSGIREIAIARHADLLAAQGREADALTLIEYGLVDVPSCSLLRRKAIDLCITRGQLDKALAHGDLLQLAPAQSESLRAAIRGACLVEEGKADAGIDLLKIAYHSASRDPLCLKHLTLALWQYGDRQTALRIYQEWQAAEPLQATIPAPAADASATAAPGETQPAPTTAASPIAAGQIRVDASQAAAPARIIFPSGDRPVTAPTQPTSSATIQ